MSNQTDKNNNTQKNKTGFFAYFKHLWKDPVKTVAEAKARKKEVLKIFFISLGLALGFQILHGIIFKNSTSFFSTIFQIPSWIGYAGLIYSVLLLFIVGKISANLKDLECPNCKEQITNIDSVEYSVKRTWVEEEKRVESGRVHVSQKEKVLVSISCVCQNCGNTKTFEKQFTTARYYDGSLRSSHDVEELVLGMFTKKLIQ